MNNRQLIDLFSPELRTASVVPRWSVVWTLTRDTVANHSYYVTFYTEAIAAAIEWLKDDAGNDPQSKLDVALAWMGLLYMARVHDLAETFTGDIVSPVKDEIIDHERYNQYELSMMQTRLPGIYAAQMEILNRIGDRRAAEMWSIIKAADRLDALLFLIGEGRMGNSVVAPRIVDAEARLRSAWHDLPAPEDRRHDLWHTVMQPVIAVHRGQGGHGV